MDKDLMNEQIKKIDEEIGRALDAITEIEEIFKKGSSSIDDTLTPNYSHEIKNKFSLLTQKVEELTKAIINTGIIGDEDCDDVEPRH